MFDLIQIGIYFEELIKVAAGYLADDGWAGLICWVLLIFLIVLSGWYLIIQQQVSKTLNEAINFVLVARDREEFSLAIRRNLNNFAKDKDKYFAKSFGRAWQEYSETLSDPEEGETTVRNTVRPHYFFNMEDLGQSSVRWRQVPGIFVSVGLLLTFLGIISAIGGLIETEETPVVYKYFDESSESHTTLNVKYLSTDGVIQYAIPDPDPQKQNTFLILKQEKPGKTPTKFFLERSLSPVTGGNWKIYKAQLPIFTDQGMAKFLNSAKSKFLMPFDFLKLIWTAMIGAWFFAEVPDTYTWIGATLIFLSGLFIAFRERSAQNHRISGPP